MNITINPGMTTVREPTGAGGLLLPFRIYNGVDVMDSTGICTLIFTDGAWQQMGGSWD